MPYDNDPGLPFILPDFTLGLTAHKGQAVSGQRTSLGLGSEGTPQTSSVIFWWIAPAPWNRGKRKRNRRRNIVCSNKTGNPELKVTTRGEGADTPVWAPAGSTKDSSSSSDSQSEGDSGLGSNPSFQPSSGY